MISFFLMAAGTSLSYSQGHLQSAAVPANAQKLVNSYPDAIKGFANNAIVFKDGSRIIWDDGFKNKTRQQRLNHPDLKDMFEQPYMAGTPRAQPAVNSDPGRIRNESFFRQLYGKSKKEVESKLTEITWCPGLTGQKIRVTTVNGVDKQLIKVAIELDRHPELKPYLTNIAGTFSWRYINGTKRLSLHSFGMTIDLNTAYSDYWQWACKCTGENTPLPYRNRIPQTIVDVFEKYGFIWGGKWYHFDTMHFEYRPELIH